MLRRSLILTTLVGFTGLASVGLAQTPPLLQPGEPYPGTALEPVHLHLPVHHKAPAEQSTTAPQATTGDTPDVAGSAGTTAMPAPGESGSASGVIRLQRHKHAASAQVANTTPETNTPVTIPFSLDANSRPAAATASAQPASVRSGSRPSASASPTPGVTRQASRDDSGSGDHANMKKRGAILFEKGAPAPSPAQYRGVKVLATNLNTDLETGASRIQLEAYGGSPGDKSSDARRLSLRRALAIRQLLIDDGVPSARIDVRAMGGADDKGPSDRVDVFVRAG